MFSFLRDYAYFCIQFATIGNSKRQDMVSFVLSLAALVLGYLVYGRFVERVLGPDDRPTPAVAQADGVDFMVLPGWKIFMIQFLNIAGTGPIFGAIMGAWYGPVAYLWIVLGCIFAGATHDYLSGMLSVRHGGANLPELVGRYLGRRSKRVMLVFSVLLLMMVGAVFVLSPAIILSGLWGTKTGWIVAIFGYYLVATLLPIDKIIGKVYPLFAFSLMFMAGALLVGLVVRWPGLPELWEAAAPANANMPAEVLGVAPFMARNPVFPCLFITIACGAISGFHATQSPLMARCMKSERQGRPIFYGSMITEGVIALVWATVSMYFFYYGGWREVLPEAEVARFMGQWQGGRGLSLVQYFDAPTVVKAVCSGWLGVAGGILALLGVVAAPITSGDTALRSARLIIADALGMGQHAMSKRLLISVPLFAVVVALLLWQLGNPDGFNTIWQYFGWANQTLSVFTLWTLTVYLTQRHKPFVITLVPALLMTVVCSAFLLLSPQALGMAATPGYALSAVVLVGALVWFYKWHRSMHNA